MEAGLREEVADLEQGKLVLESEDPAAGQVFSAWCRHRWLWEVLPGTEDQLPGAKATSA